MGAAAPLFVPLIERTPGHTGARGCFDLQPPRRCSMTFQKAFRALAGAAALAFAFTAQAAVPLPKLNVDTTKTTVSGLSSGGFMANQLGYAYSSTFMGVGVFAGGPYMCAGHNNYTACMYNASISSAMLSTTQTDINNWSGTQIHAKANVANQKIYMFVGTSDFTVGPNP